LRLIVLQLPGGVLTPICNVMLSLELGDGGIDNVQFGEVYLDPVEPTPRCA